MDDGEDKVVRLRALPRPPAEEVETPSSTTQVSEGVKIAMLTALDELREAVVANKLTGMLLFSLDEDSTSKATQILDLADIPSIVVLMERVKISLVLTDPLDEDDD